MAGKFKVIFVFLLGFFLKSPACFADFHQYLAENCRQTGSFKERHSPFKYWVCLDKDNKPQQACGLTGDICPQVKGYSGIINIFFCLNSQGKIIYMEVVSHRETLEYAAGITSFGFKKQFIGKSPLDENFRLGRAISGITGATISSAAVVKALRRAGRKIYSQAFLQSGPVSANAESASSYLKSGIIRSRPQKTASFASRRAFKMQYSARLGFICLYSILAIIVMVNRNPAWRWFFVFFSVIFLGFVKQMFLSIYNLENIRQMLNSGVYISFCLGFLIIVLIATLIFGRVYCGFICPFGALQDIFSLLPFKKKIVPYRINRRLVLLKYIILGIVLSLLGFGCKEGLKLEVFTPVFKLMFKNPGFWIGVVFLIASAFIPRFYCRYFCLVGAVLGIAAKFSFLKYKIPCKNKHCRICQGICLTGVVDENKNIIDNECVRCNLCQKCSLEKRR